MIFRPLPVLLVLLSFTTGCANSNTIRKWVTMGDTVNGAAARVADAAVTACAAEAVTLAEASKFAESHAKQAACVKLRNDLATGIKIGIDVTATANNSIEVSEAVNAKDYTNALTPFVAGMIKLVQIFKDAGLKIPVSLPGVN